jgi:Legume-like lectin family
VKQVSGDNSHLYGDGMAMWITSDRAQTGSAFGNKDNFNGLGIMLDTYVFSSASKLLPISSSADTRTLDTPTLSPAFLESDSTAQSLLTTGMTVTSKFSVHALYV